MNKQFPLLDIPFKRTADCVFDALLHSYIEQVLQEDPSNYQKEIHAFQQCRQDARGAEKNFLGRDLLARYYGQIEYLLLRFPIGEEGIKCSFEWYDAFSGIKVSQHSIAFEKANILFNSGSIASSIASSSNRNDSQGQKLAYNYFQLSAGYLQFINDNFLHPPSVDLSRESIKVLVDLMLAQAQETFVEKVLSEQKKGLLVSKLAAYLSFAYAGVVEGMAEKSLKAQFPSVWTHLLKTKIKYFSALALYHKALHAESTNEYGQIITYLTASHSTIQEAVKTGNTFISNFYSLTQNLTSPLFSSTSSNPPPIPTSDTISITEESVEILESSCKSLMASVSEALKVALKDNDLLYHASVPPIETLPALEKFNAAKPILLHDLLPNGKSDVLDIIGADIFAKLVPQEITVKASLYDDKKDTMIRFVKDLVSSSQADVDAKLKSLQFRETLVKLKASLGSAQDSSVDAECPRELVHSLASIGCQDNLCDLVSRISQKCAALKKSLEEIAAKLDQEQHECETMRIKYGQSWKQSPSLHHSRQFLDERSRIDSSLNTKIRQCQQLAARISNLSKFLDLTRQPKTAIAAAFAALASSRKTEKRPSLLDDSIADAEGSKRDESTFLTEMDLGLQKLESFANEKKRMCDELVSKMKSDDISPSLLLVKGREDHIIGVEIAKFQPAVEAIEGVVNRQTLFLDNLIKSFCLFTSLSKTLMQKKVQDDKVASVIEDWERNVELAYDLSKEGETLMISINEQELKTSTLLSSARHFINQRNAERDAMVKSIEMAQAEISQQSLLTQLNRMNVVGGPGNAGFLLPMTGGISPPTQPTSISYQNSTYVPPPYPANQPQPFVTLPGSLPLSLPNAALHFAGVPVSGGSQAPAVPIYQSSTSSLPPPNVYVGSGMVRDIQYGNNSLPQPNSYTSFQGLGNSSLYSSGNHHPAPNQYQGGSFSQTPAFNAGNAQTPHYYGQQQHYPAQQLQQGTFIASLQNQQALPQQNFPNQTTQYHESAQIQKRNDLMD